MAGHSKFKNIMHRKGGQDAKRSKLFSKLSREITVAAKMGQPDPDFNPRLRAVILTARAASMPKDNIARALQKAEGGDAANYEEVRYEGFGPGGVAVIVEALTDNRNRTATDVRTAFAKNGGNVGTAGSVSHGFDRVGVIGLPWKAGTPDQVFEAALEAGADDVQSSEPDDDAGYGGDEGGHEVFTAVDDLHEIARALEAKLGPPESAKLAWRPQVEVTLNATDAATLMRMIDALEESDDVQTVYGNHDVPDEVAAAL